MASPAIAFRGVGGQLDALDDHPSAVDWQGRLWVPLGTRGFAQWDPAIGVWLFVHDPAWPSIDLIRRLSNGDLLAAGTSLVLRLPNGSSDWTIVSSDLPEQWGIRQIGPDGTLYVLQTHWSFPAKLFALAAGASEYEELPLPTGIDPQALAWGSDGELFVAGLDDAEQAAVYRRATNETTWTATGPGSPGSPETTYISAHGLAEAPDGVLYALGTGVFGLEPGGGTWRTVGVPGIAGGVKVNDLHVDFDGSWTLASVGVGAGEESLYCREDAGSPWVGIGPDMGNFNRRITRITPGRPGEVHLIDQFGTVDSVHNAAGTFEDRPYNIAFGVQAGNSILDFAATLEGDLYVSLRENPEVVLYRHKPGAASWEVVTWLPAHETFARGSDGSLWATDQLNVQRLRQGRTAWDVASDGLDPWRPGDTHLAADDDGTMYLSRDGVGFFRRTAASSSWERFGFGTPSIGVTKLTARGGKVWAMADNQLFLLDLATRIWMPIQAMLPVSPTTVFDAAADGSLLLGGRTEAGLVQSYALP